MLCNKKHNCLAALLFIALVIGASESLYAYSDSENLSPVTWECICQTSEKFDIPLAMLVVILDTEAGKVGKVSQNTNGTYDIGPMQINSIWLPTLRRVGISETTLKNNGCVNVAVAGWLLRSHIRSTKSHLAAISAYHSKTPSLGSKYLNAVKYRAFNVDVHKTIKRANTHVKRG